MDNDFTGDGNLNGDNANVCTGSNSLRRSFVRRLWLKPVIIKRNYQHKNFWVEDNENNDYRFSKILKNSC